MIEGTTLLARLFLGLGALQLAGYGFLAWICPASAGLSRLERHAVSFGLGALIVTLWMLILGLLGIPFGLPQIIGPLLSLPGTALLGGKIFRRKEAALAPIPQTTENRKPKPENRWVDWLFLSLLAVLFLFACLRAVLYPMWGWDALATWGFKAKVFYVERALDFSRIKAHNYYPNLAPLLLTYLYLCLGQVNDHLVKLVFPLFGAGLLALLYSLLLRMGLTRRESLGLTAFFALNGVTFIVHLYIAYADLPLAYYTLGAVGFTYLWLQHAAPAGCLPLIACFAAGMAWGKFEGPPLAATIVLAALLTLLWLRPPSLSRRLLGLAWPVAGILAGSLLWQLFLRMHHIDVGSDHILGFYTQQFWQAVPALLKALSNPKFFGILWLAAFFSLLVWRKSLLTTPRLFLALFIGGNLLAILLGYAVAPTAAEEFPLYVRATVDRLLLHISPVAALLVGEAWKDLRKGPG